MRVTIFVSFYFVFVTVGYVTGIGMELFGNSNNYDHKIIEDNENSQNNYENLFNSVHTNKDNDKLFEPNDSPKMEIKGHIIKRRAIEESMEKGSGNDTKVDKLQKEIENPKENKNNSTNTDTDHKLDTNKELLDSVKLEEANIDDKKAKNLNETAKVPLIHEILPVGTTKEKKGDDSKPAESPINSNKPTTLKNAIVTIKTTTPSKVTENIMANNKTIQPSTVTPKSIENTTTKKDVHSSIDVNNKLVRTSTIVNNVKVDGTSELLSSTAAAHGITTIATNLSEINDMNPPKSVDTANKLVIQEETAAIIDDKNSKNLKKAKKMNREPLNKEQSGLVMLNSNAGTLEETEKAVGNMQSIESLQYDPEPKTGQSSEKETTTNTGRSDSTLIIVLGAAVITVGVAAFTYNFVKRNQMQREQENNTMSTINEDPEAGRELKPLMKNGDDNKQHNVEIVECKDDTANK